MFRTREVWRNNFDEEMLHVKHCLGQYSFIAFDTEFPGFISWTSKHASEYERYRAMKFNVERTKLIQFGFTLFNACGEIGGTWEFNFSNFGEPSDARNEASISFLTLHGLDLKKIREDGIDMFVSGFFLKFFNMLSYQRNTQWVTFHGNYDLAYVMSILNRGLGFSGKLPATSDEFADAVGRIFGVVHDLKVIASSCESLGDHLGLENMAQRLRVQRIGHAHHAGSDSLLTAFLFIKINRFDIDTKISVGYLYGMRKRVIPSRATEIPSYCGVICNRYKKYNPQMFYDNYPTHLDTRTIYNGTSSENPWWYNALPLYTVQAANASLTR